MLCTDTHWTATALAREFAGSRWSTPAPVTVLNCQFGHSSHPVILEQLS